MKDETGDVPIKESLGLKPKVYSFLVDDRSENKKIKGLKKKVAQKITYIGYKYFLLNKKCFRHLMNRIQSKGHKTGTYEIKKLSLSCFDNKIHILNNGLALGYQR